MNTKRKITARKRWKWQFITFILCVFLIGGVIGGGIVVGVSAVANSDDATKQEETALPSKYGTRDGKTLAEIDEPSIDYTASAEFEPLECALPYELQEFTYYLCEAYYIDFEFAMAVMFTESSFRTDVISATSDYGLMQINECNHTELADKLGITDFTEPYQNIRAGLYILRGLFEKYDEPAKVCMAYNMGEYGASVLWDKGVYETSYSKKVLSVADEYELQRGGGVNE